MDVNSDIIYVYILSAIAGFILLIACINFMNLATAQSATRTREVGMRKVMGASRAQLVSQFLGESVLITLLALMLALLMIFLILPAFNTFVEKHIEINAVDRLSWVLGLIGITGLVGFIAGSYPAFFLAAFQPVEVLKKQIQGHATSGLLRKGLVVVQCVLFIIMIVYTSLMYEQQAYFQNLSH